MKKNYNAPVLAGAGAVVVCCSLAVTRNGSVSDPLAGLSLGIGLGLILLAVIVATRKARSAR